jgi:hypothetical protein
MTGSANLEAVSRKACLAGNGPVLVKRRNAVNNGFKTRPTGVTQLVQSSIA